MSKVTQEEAINFITDYMVRENRPYSANDVFNNLHREYGKTLVVRCLDAGVENGTLCEKTVSKQKIYFANQDRLETCEDAHLFEMDKLIATKSAELGLLNNNVKTLQNELKAIECSLTTADLNSEIARLEAEIKNIEKDIVNLMLSEDKKNVKEKERINMIEASYKNEWKKRKSIALEMLRAICENCTLSKKKLIEDIGIELDEAVE